MKISDNMKWEQIIKKNCGCGKDPCETYGEVKKGKGERHFYIENGKPVQWTGETHKHPDGTLMSGKEHKEGVSKKLLHFHELDKKHLKHLSKETTVIKILETQMGFSQKKFDSESSYRDYQRALRETNDRKGFLKELVKRYKQNNKQPLTSDIVNSVLSAFKYTRGRRNTQSISGGGVMGGNDYGF